MRRVIEIISLGNTRSFFNKRRFYFQKIFALHYNELKILELKILMTVFM